MLRSFFAVLLALLSLSAAPLQEVPTAPIAGTALGDLLCKHRHHPDVVKMLDWMEHSTFEKPSGDIVAHGALIRFEDSRVVRVALTISNASKSSCWSGSLPAGLTRTTLESAIKADRNWESRGRQNHHKSKLHRMFGETSLEGTEAQVIYAFGRLQEVALVLDLQAYWKTYCTAIQAQIDVSQFSSDFWFGTVGADVASANADLLTAWVGLAPGRSRATRAGLTVTMGEGRWIERIAFDSEFKGERPLKTGPSPTRADIITHLGPAEGAEPQTPYWHISFPDRSPTHLHLTPATEPDKGRATLALSRPRAEVVRWLALMNGTGAPDAELVSSIGDLWSRAIEAHEPLHGRSEARKGAFGTIEQWSSRLLLGNVIGGTITAPYSFDITPMTRIEYVLRQVSDGTVKAEAALKPFIAPMSGLLGDTFVLSERAADGVVPTSVTWRTKSDDPLSPGPSLSVEARKPIPAANGSARPGFDLFLVIRVPE